MGIIAVLKFYRKFWWIAPDINSIEICHELFITKKRYSGDDRGYGMRAGFACKLSSSLFRLDNQLHLTSVVLKYTQTGIVNRQLTVVCHQCGHLKLYLNLLVLIV